MYYFLNCFFIYSILGHLLESFIFSFYIGESGVLYGLWTPIYGIGCFCIILINELISKKFSLNNFFKVLLLFLSSGVVISTIEYASGVLIEKIFNIIFWDYSNLKFSIGKYTSVEMGIIWGVAAIILIYILKPVIDRFQLYIPKILTIILLFMFIFDCCITYYFKVL